MQEALAAYQRGDWTEAERLCRLTLAARSDDFDALGLLGIIAAQTRRAQEAVELLSRAVSVNPGNADAHSNLGRVLHDLNRLEEALQSYDRALAIDPENAGVLNNRGVALNVLKRYQEALGSYERALAIKPDHAETLNNRGNALVDLHRHEEALESYSRALTIKPDYADALYNRGNALADLQRHEDALESYDRALRIKPDYAEALNSRAVALSRLKRHEDALESCNRALALKPDYAEALNSRGVALADLNRHEEALESYGRALASKPDLAAALNNRGNALADLKRYKEALQSYDDALKLQPDHPFLYGTWLHTRLRICDWQNLQNDISVLVSKVSRGEKASSPFPVLTVSGSPALQRQAAETWVKDKHSVRHALPEPAARAKRGRIRVGYFSADFHNHATALLMAELFERHDRSSFELIAFSFGPDREDDVRKRVAAVFDQFIDVRAQSDEDVALLSRRLAVDIAVDLKGYTQDSRPGIFASRAAPLQVSYLGYPGTMGSDCIDYLIADLTLVPESSRRHYTEKIAYLPNSYQVNDARRSISDRVFTREEAGLPPLGFVFCCFNNSFKITPGVFDGWMRVLSRVEGSVLWLLADNPKAAANLRREAVQRGINAERLIFAARMPLPEHLARHRLADLFVDTLPYNAHTTASDALWAGLPVLTCAGEAFASRVAASLLNAIRLPELIASTQEEYEGLAIELATRPARLAHTKLKLANNRLTTPLFDTRLFSKHIEAAYAQMYERHQAGLPPEHIYIKP